VSHTDPTILALLALGEHSVTAQDEAHTAQCAECQLELERLSRVVELARTGGPVILEQPPAAVWERIAAATGEDAAPAVPVRDDPVPDDVVRAAANGHRSAGRGRLTRPAGRRRRGLRVAIAGAVAGLIVGIGGTVAVTQLARPPASQVVAEIELRPLPQFPQWRGAAGTALLRDTAAAQQLAVAVTAPRRSGFYEVWLLGQDGTSMISLGELSTANTGTFTLPAGVNLRFYSRVDVSLQPFNGSTAHSSVSVVRGSMPPAATAAAGRG
jgi:hypothetical protein